MVSSFLLRPTLLNTEKKTKLLYCLYWCGDVSIEATDYFMAAIKLFSLILYQKLEAFLFFLFFLQKLSGSGKSYLAKMLRDIEVENGGSAPRVHSMDDYFMTEVEKVLFFFLIYVRSSQYSPCIIKFIYSSHFVVLFTFHVAEALMLLKI